jgi:hypothetical protein
MKIKISYRIVWVSIVSLFLSSCSDFLKEEIYTQYDPTSFLQTEEGINSVLVASYSNMQVNANMRDRMYLLNEFPGDIMWEWGGSLESTAVLFMGYSWDSQSTMFSTPWQQYYESIRNTNALLDNIDKVTALSADKIKQFKAEARFIRAADYYYLWEYFGPVPLITTAAELNLEPLRATDAEFNTFLSTELQAAATDLPLTQSLWGKATKGAALALLGRFYLNTLQWQKATDLNKQVMDLNKYKLFSGDLKKYVCSSERSQRRGHSHQSCPHNTPWKQLHGARLPPKLSHPVQLAELRSHVLCIQRLGQNIRCQRQTFGMVPVHLHRNKRESAQFAGSQRCRESCPLF